MGPTGCPETPVRNYNYSLRKTRTAQFSSTTRQKSEITQVAYHIYVNRRFLSTTLYHIQQSYEREWYEQTAAFSEL